MIKQVKYMVDIIIELILFISNIAALTYIFVNIFI